MAEICPGRLRPTFYWRRVREVRGSVFDGASTVWCPIGGAKREAAGLGVTLRCYSSWRMKTLNELFSKLSMRRRYEVWFLRLGLSDGSGAWWLRYLLMNPGRGGCAGDAQGQAVQVWATWFPREGKPETWIQGFPLESLRSNGEGSSKAGSSETGLSVAGLSNVGLGKAGLSGASSGNAGLSERGASPFFLEVGENRIGENGCRGRMMVGGQKISWAQQQGMDWVFAHAAFRRGFLGRDCPE